MDVAVIASGAPTAGPPPYRVYQVITHSRLRVCTATALACGPPASASPDGPRGSVSHGQAKGAQSLANHRSSRT